MTMDTGNMQGRVVRGARWSTDRCTRGKEHTGDGGLASLTCGMQRACRILHVHVVHTSVSREQPLHDRRVAECRGERKWCGAR